MLRFIGPISVLQTKGFLDTGDGCQFFCHFDRKTGINHTLKLKFKTYIPRECDHPYAKSCMECKYKGDCELLRTRTLDGRIGHKSPESIFVEGFSTEDSNPDNYIISLIKDYIREI